MLRWKQRRNVAAPVQSLELKDCIHISEGILCRVRKPFLYNRGGILRWALQILILTLQNDTHLDMGYHRR